MRPATLRHATLKNAVLAVLATALLAACGGGGGSAGIQSFWTSSGVVVADLNGDGRPDIVVANTYVDSAPPHFGQIAIYLQTASGSYASPLTYRVGDDPWGVAVGDIDGDGRPDIAVANTNSNSVSILLQDAANPGTWLAARAFAVGGVPYDVALGDLNGDGRTDLAVGLQNTGGGAVLLMQTAGPTLNFAAPMALASGSGALAVAIGDLNQDGRNDVAVTGATAVTVFLQTALAGTFGPGTAYTTGLRPSDVAITDVSGDGRNDLIVANAGNSGDGSNATVTVLLQDNVTPGTFAAAVNYPVANGARQLAISQITGSASPDIALISVIYQSTQLSKLSVLVNQGNGSFTAGAVNDAPLLANFLAIGDLNGDGLTDLVTNEGPTRLLQDAAAPGTFKAGTAIQ